MAELQLRDFADRFVVVQNIEVQIRGNWRSFVLLSLSKLVIVNGNRSLILLTEQESLPPLSHFIPTLLFSRKETLVEI